MLNIRGLIAMLVSLTLLGASSVPVVGLDVDPLAIPTSASESDGIYHTVSLEDSGFPAGVAPESFEFVIDLDLPPNLDGEGGLLEVLFDKITLPASEDITYTEILSVMVGDEAYEPLHEGDCSVDPADLPGFLLNNNYTACDEDGTFHVVLGNLTRSATDSVSIEIGITDAPTQPDSYSLDIILSTSAHGIYDTAPGDPIGSVSDAGVPLREAHSIEFEVGPPPVDTIQIQVPASIQVGHSDSFSASAVDDQDQPVVVAEYSWSISPIGCGHLSVGQDTSEAFFFAGSTAQECTLTVTETLSEVSGEAVFDVVAGAAFTIEFDHAISNGPKNVSVDPLQYEVFVTVYDAFGNPAPDQDLYWSLILGEDKVDLSETSTPTGNDGRASVLVTFPSEIDSESIIGTEFRVRAVDDPEDAQRTRNSGTWVIVPGALDPTKSTLAIPGDTVAGENLTATLTLRDQFDNLLDHGIHNKTGDIRIVLGGANAAPDETPPECAGVPLGEDTTVTFTDAEATFDCILYAAETIDLQIFEVEDEDFDPFGPSINVAPAAADHLAWTAGAETIIAGECSEYTLQVRDGFLNPQSEGAITISLSGEASGAFYTDRNGGVCEGPTGDVTIEDEQSSVTFYYHNQVNENVTLNAASTGIHEDTLAVEVHPAVLDSFVIHADPEQTAGEAFTFDLEAVDEFGNRVNRSVNLYEGEKNLTLSGPGIAPAGNEPECEGTSLGEEFTVEFNAGFATGLTCTLYNREIVALVVENTTTGITGNLEIEVLAAAFDVFEIDPSDDEPVQYVGRGTTNPVTATALDIYANPKPGVQMYAWLKSFGDNQMNDATLSDASGTTDTEGNFTTQLTVSNANGDKYIVEMSNTPHPAQDIQTSAVFEVVTAVGEEEEYQTIQSAVNEADEGDKIVVREGTYEESVTINTIGLHLIADGGVIVRANDTLAGSNSAPTLRLNANNITVEGFVIERVIDNEQTAGSSMTRAVHTRDSDISIIGGAIHTIDETGIDENNVGLLIGAPPGKPTSNIKLQNVEIYANLTGVSLISESSMDGVEFTGNTILGGSAVGFQVRTIGGQAPENILLGNNEFSYDPNTSPYVWDHVGSLDLDSVLQKNNFLFPVEINTAGDRIFKSD